MKPTLILLTLILASCATHKATQRAHTATTAAALATTHTTAQTAATARAETRSEAEAADTDTLRLHTATWTARDTVHATDTVHTTLYLTATRLWRLRDRYEAQASSADTTQADTTVRTRTDTVRQVRQTTVAPTHSAADRLLVAIVAFIAVLSGLLCGRHIARHPIDE